MSKIENFSLPVMGLIFLRHAYSRFLAVERKLQQRLANRLGDPAVRLIDAHTFTWILGDYERPGAKPSPGRLKAGEVVGVTAVKEQEVDRSLDLLDGQAQNSALQGGMGPA